MLEYNDGTIRRIDKRIARKLYNAGQGIILLPCKANPLSKWFLLHGCNKADLDFMSFDYLCNNFSYYNCSNKLGTYIAFYVKCED